MNRTRNDRIRKALDAATEAGEVLSYYVYAPGDGSRRWVVETPAHSERSYATAEVEVFIEGLEAAWAGRTRRAVHH